MQLVVAGRVRTGFPGELYEPGALLVEDTSIVEVGHPDELSPGDHTVIDLGSAVLVPGMIDSHVHLAFDASDHPVQHMMNATDHELLVTMLYNARLLLEAGVTTARDLGARAYLDVVVRDAVDRQVALGPNLLVSNRPLTTTGGHCWFMGCECDDAVSIRRAVRDHHKRGADWVKIMATGGGMTAGSAPWFAQFSQEEIGAAVAEARRLGMRVAAHAHGAPGILAAARAGVDTVEHCSFRERQGRRVDPEAVAALAENDVAVCATTNLRWVERGRDRQTAAVERVGALREAGVRLIAGTDAGITRVSHGAYAEGLLGLEALGLSPEEVLAAATSVAAEALGIGDVTGRLSPGMRADVVALRRDPVEDLSAVRDVVWVMRNGQSADSGHFERPVASFGGRRE